MEGFPLDLRNNDLDELDLDENQVSEFYVFYCKSLKGEWEFNLFPNLHDNDRKPNDEPEVIFVPHWQLTESSNELDKICRMLTSSVRSP